jgi:hypothetical protein
MWQEDPEIDASHELGLYKVSAAGKARRKALARHGVADPWVLRLGACALDLDWPVAAILEHDKIAEPACCDSKQWVSINRIVVQIITTER